MSTPRRAVAHASADAQTPAVSAHGTLGAHGLDATSDVGNGVTAESERGYAVCASSSAGTAVYAHSFGTADAVVALSEHGVGISAMGLGTADAVYATSVAGNGVHAVGGAALGNGVTPQPAGVFAEGGEGCGIYAVATAGDGVVGVSDRGRGVDAFSSAGVALRARCGSAAGLALAVEGRITVSFPVAGEVVLQAGTSAVSVASMAATPRSQVILTPLADIGEGVRMWISLRESGSFTISTSEPARHPVALQYLIVN